MPIIRPRYIYVSKDERIHGYISKPKGGPRVKHCGDHRSMALHRDTLYWTSTRYVNKYGKCALEFMPLRKAPYVRQCANFHEPPASMADFISSFCTELPEDLTGLGHRHLTPDRRGSFFLRKGHTRTYKGILITAIPRFTSSQLMPFVPTPNVLSQERKFVNAMLKESSSC